MSNDLTDESNSTTTIRSSSSSGGGDFDNVVVGAANATREATRVGNEYAFMQTDEERSPFLITNEMNNRRLRERQEISNRKFVFKIVRVVNVFLLLFLVVSTFLITFKVSKSMESTNWFVIFSPLYCILFLWILRCSLKLSVLPPSEVLALSVPQYGTRPVESSVRSILITVSLGISLSLWGCRLQGVLPLINAISISAPVVACLSGFIVYGLFNVLLRSTDPQLSEYGNKQRNSAMRLELIIFTFTCATLIMFALKVDKILETSWFIVFAWPMIVLCFWAIAALAFSCVILSWWVSVCSGKVDTLDWYLINIVDASSDHIGPSFRLKAVSIATFYTVCVDLLVVGISIAGFQLIRALNMGKATPAILDFISIPLIMDSIILFVSLTSFEFIILPYLDGLRLSVENDSQPIMDNDSIYGRDGKPLPVKSCTTCRQPIDKIVKIDAANVHVLEPDELPSSMAELNVNENTTAKQKRLELPDCSICMRNESNAIFLPCGHGGVCFECASQWVYGVVQESRNKKDMEKTTSNALDQLSPVHTPLLLVRQSNTFFKAVFTNKKT